MNAITVNPAPATPYSLSDLYYWDAAQQCHVWTELHLRLFLEAANEPLEVVQVDPDVPHIICTVDSLEHLL